MPKYILLLLFLIPIGGFTQHNNISYTGQFPPCPSSPNCISTQADSSDQQHYFPPIKYTGDWTSACNDVAEILGSMKRITFTNDSAGYFTAIYRVPFWGFKDDIEIYLPIGKGLIHLRSASRLGHSDLGANRKRAEWIRQQFRQRERK